MNFLILFHGPMSESGWPEVESEIVEMVIACEKKVLKSLSIKTKNIESFYKLGFCEIAHTKMIFFLEFRVHYTIELLKFRILVILT